MSDLISRKAVMDYLREQQANVIIEKSKENPVTYEATKGMIASAEAFMNFINQIPSAYDVNNVVKQLNNLEIYNNEKESSKFTDGYACAIDSAIEIVEEVVAEHNCGWIPVVERLPENGETVLAYIKHNYGDYGWRAYRVYEYTDYWAGIGNLCEVIAWQPLPEPYKEDK